MHLYSFTLTPRRYHASLSTSPDYELAKAQMPGGCGAMLAINLKDPDAAQRLPAALTLFKDATSLGAVESLIEWRRKYDEVR
jgi:cystathionine gamma-synthase